ncbi:MAG TPA: 3-dehydroquinate synthase [Pseudogracilibacillus sp.]|nr:3-dehydroquinate synthase [Pseudogracilibacillus sp.]
MKQLRVNTSTHDYTISIDEHIRFKLTDFLTKKYSKILIITDDQIAPLYLSDVYEGLQGEDVVHTIIPSGEATKSIEYYYQLQTTALENRLDRHSLIIALGGGVIGDLSGFVASTFMRGIDYIQMPTTILAHDSSVGGKVAINHELGKNLIGSFYPPVAVIYDVHMVQTLPEHEIRSGYAELVKEAYISDEGFLKQLLSQPLTSISKNELMEHLYQGVKVKANIVEQDEKEMDIRKFLNFGHTLAHAMEASLGYGRVTHGEAVAIGMLFALKVSEQVYQVDLQYHHLYTWLEKNNYPLSLFKIDIEKLIHLMKLDKKTLNKNIQFVLLKEIGEPTVYTMEESYLKETLQLFKKELTDK